MLEIIAIIYVGLSAVCGFGFAWFFAFFALDDLSIPVWAEVPVYIIAFIILGILFSLAAMALLPVLIYDEVKRLLSS